MSSRTRLFPPVVAALFGALTLGSLAFTPPTQAATPAARPAATSGVHGDPPADRGKQGPSAVFPRSSYLCYGYDDCRRSGMGNGGYAAHNGTMYWRMYAGHNCTNYAAYRMVHSGLPNVRPWSGSGNAMYWGTSMPKITDGTPQVGAVAWWKANTGPAGSVGHVAYVERVVSADQIVVSQDSWHGDFSWATITRSSGNWPSGFIHFNDLALRNTARPVVSGLAKVGSVLSTTPGTWRPSSPQISYQWYADGQPISGAVNPTLRLSRALVDQRITVVATATSAGYPSVRATSAATGPVLPGRLRNVTPPHITGTPQVDGTLTVDTGSWDPQPSLQVQWLAGGAPIAGATATSLALPPELVGKPISARVTATRTGYDPVSATSAPTAPVAPGTIVATAAPSIAGDVGLGQTLTVDPGTYHPGDARLAVQWLRDGEPVPGATDRTYALTPADLGSRLSTRVTVARAGYRTTELLAPATAVLRSRPALQATDRIGRHRMRVWVTVTAPGVTDVAGTVRLRTARMTQSATLRGGVARFVLTDVPPGTRTLKIRYRGSDTVARGYLSRTVRIG